MQNGAPRVSAVPVKNNIPAGRPARFGSYLPEAEGTTYWLAGKSFKVKLSWGTI